MFDERDPDIGILVISTAVPGEKIRTSVSNGDSVTLHVGSEEILVRDVSIEANGAFKGVIYGLEPSHSSEFGGLKLGQEISFGERNVFGCQHT